MSGVKLSAVICTHNRPDDLWRCLDAFAILDDSVEVIVVDSASTPPCRELVEAYTSSIPQLTYLRENAPGLARARNRGLEAAGGDIVAFVDDDAAPHYHWARRIVEPFHDPSVGCVGGSCRAFFPDCERPHWLSDRLLQFAGITRFETPREARSSAEWPFGANIAFRREALEDAGGFPEHLGRTGTALLSGEESAAIEAVRDTGWRVVLHPDAAVDHAVPGSRCVSRYYWQRLWWAGVTRARMRGRRGPTLARLLAAAPIRICLYAVTWDRVYLYRLAETAGFLRDLATPRPSR
jgi:cellulose synthase/poly-beta-1,6-N-acetylglucosamine synthase-like glycosyltransferase